MNDPPDQTAEFNAANLLSVGGITFAKCSRKISSFSRKAESVSLKTIPILQVLPSCCGKQPLIRTVQKHLLNIFVLLQESLIYQTYCLISSGTSSQDFSDFSDGFT